MCEGILPEPLQLLPSCEDDSCKSPSISIPAIAAGVAAIFVVAIIIAICVIRRRKGIESDLERKVIPRYAGSGRKIKLVSKISSGGFGVVWKGEYEGKTVAVKMLNLEKAKTDSSSDEKLKQVKMVCDEAETMQLMTHERIVKFLFFEVESLGLVLELMPLGSLYDRIAKGVEGFPWKDRYQVFLDICEGMEFLHSSSYSDGSPKQILLHQDLKSANVLLGIEDNVLRGKLSDFGLSCICFF